MINYEFKSTILNNFNDLIVAERKASMFSYSLYLFKDYGLINHSLKNADDESMTYEQLQRYCACLGLTEELKECGRINHAFFQRVKRLQKRVADIVKSGSSSFLTLTFRNDVLSSTSALTRRRYVQRYCNSLGVPYVANIDFGDTTHREHYHVICAKHVNTKTWQYGFIDIEKTRSCDSDITRMSKYISKLTNHAIKETTTRCNLIYSR